MVPAPHNPSNWRLVFVGPQRMLCFTFITHRRHQKNSFRFAFLAGQLDWSHWKSYMTLTVVCIRHDLYHHGWYVQTICFIPMMFVWHEYDISLVVTICSYLLVYHYHRCSPCRVCRLPPTRPAMRIDWWWSEATDSLEPQGWQGFTITGLVHGNILQKTRVYYQYGLNKWLNKW